MFGVLTYTIISSLGFGVKLYTAPSDRQLIVSGMSRKRTTEPFAEELPRLLAERGVTLRALAEAVGGFDHAYLSRLLSGSRAVNAVHAARIAVHLGLPADYFPEVREARVVDAITADGELRDRVYDRMLPSSRRSVQS